MTLNAFQKGQIDKFMENHSEALFKSLCEKHKVDMDKLEDADVFNLVGEVREINENVPAGTYNKSKASPSTGGETKQAATTTTRVIQEPKAPAQKTFTPQAQKEFSQIYKTPIKKLEDYLIDLRNCYPGRRFEIKTTIQEKTDNFCLTKCELLISDKELGYFKFESFGYAVKSEEGEGQQKKYMIPLSEARAVKRACRLATVGVKPDQDKKI
jgi:hypothetical protein